MNQSSTSGQTALINDMEMYVEVRGAGEPLILLHGGGGIGAHWNLIFSEPPNNYQLIVPDLRGHGRSTNPKKEFTFRQSSLDVFALLDHLGIEQFKAVGMSLGAKTLLHMATQQPARVEAMVLVSATPYFPAQARSAMGALTSETHSEAEWQQMRAWHPQGDEQIASLWQQLGALKDSYDDMNFTPPYLGTIAARTLIVHGDRDPLYPIHLALEMYAAIPESYLWVIPNGGHGPIFGKTAAQFIEIVMEFLQNSWGKKV